MKYLRKKAFCTLGIMTVGLFSGSVSANELSVVAQWNVAMLEAVRSATQGPPMIARSLSIAHTCMYDAWAAYDEKANGTMFRGTLRKPIALHTVENKHEAISYAAYHAVSDVFPDHQSIFDQLMTDLGYANLVVEEGTPAHIGIVACDAVLEYRHHDGSNQLGDLSPGAYSDYTGYEPKNSPDNLVDQNAWQPLRLPTSSGGISEQQFLAPHWGKVTPFSFRTPKRFKFKEPAKYGTDEYLEQAKQVLSYSASLTDSQKAIAEYWADGPHSETPPGHWNLFAQFISTRDQHSIDQDVKMYFALNNAVMDAGIAAWWAKVHYDYVRPVSSIRYLFRDTEVFAWIGEGMGAGMIMGQNWTPYQQTTALTPPFAEYVSGHSTFSSAAARVLAEFTGSDVFGYSETIAQGSSLVEPGLVPATDITFSWPTFTDAAIDAGLSRLYGGIHFRDGDIQGRKLGNKIGQLTWRKASRLFNSGKKENNN